MKKGILLMTVVLSAILVPCNIRLYLPILDASGLPSDAFFQLAALEEAVEADAPTDMQRLFPEGYFFTTVLYGDSWLNAISYLPRDDPRYPKGLAEAAEALQTLDDPAARAPFLAALDPPYGIFYTGWKAWLRGHRLSLMRPHEWEPQQVEQFQAECDLIAGALEQSRSPYLESYFGQAWPVDTVVAVAALNLHDHLFEPRYQAIIAGWITGVRSRPATPQGVLIAHRIDPGTGQVIDEPRGSSQSLINRFLVEIDPVWAAESYRAFREEYVVIPLGVREYPRGTAGSGDVDSGPLVLGISASATVVGIGAARVNGDEALAQALTNGAEAVGMPLTIQGQKRYGLGLLPIGDLFLLWSKTAHNVVYETPEGHYPSPPPLWRLPYHIGSGLLITLPWGLFQLAKRVKSRRRGSSQRSAEVSAA